MKLSIIKGNFGRDFGYVVSSELQKALHGFIADKIFADTGLGALKPGYTLEIGFFADDNEEAWGLVRSKANHKKKDLPFGIRMSRKKLSLSPEESLAYFLSFFEAGITEITRILGGDATKAGFLEIKQQLMPEAGKLWAQPDENSKLRKFLKAAAV